MKIAPTIEGGLKIEPESEEDWYVLRAICQDAKGGENDLASRMGDLITDEKISEDWNDIVVPDLRESFWDDLHHVSAEIDSAAAFAKHEEAAIWITQDDAPNWYSALNQARLALEEAHHFGNELEIEIEKFGPVQREAFFRNQFYCALQSFILERVMNC